MVQNVSTNTYGVAKWIVDATLSNGTHTTIGAALTSASSGDTIFIRPGSYTENLTLKAAVNLVAFNGDGGTPNVTIIGKMSGSYSGTASVSNMRLQTNSDNIIALTGSNATILKIYNCYLNCTNTTGIVSSGSNASSNVSLYDCEGNLGTTGIGLFAISNGSLAIDHTNIGNTGLSTTASTVSSAAAFQETYSNMNIPITTSNTASFGLYYSVNDTSATNTTTLVINGTGSSSLVYSTIASGTATPLTIGAGASVLLTTSTLNHQNATAVSGAGTLNYSQLGQTSTIGTIVPTSTLGYGTIGKMSAAAPTAGYIGEQIVSRQDIGSATPLTTATPKSIMSVALTPGIWDINLIFGLYGATTKTSYSIGISANTNSFTGTVDGDSRIDNNYPTGTFTNNWYTTLPQFRVLLGSNTTYYGVVTSNFTVGTETAWGRLSAVRVA